MTASALPPGPRMPAAMQSLGWWARPTSFLERCRARYGKTFTVNLPAQGPFVMVSDPADLTAVKRIYDIVEGRDERVELNLYITGTDEDNAEHPPEPTSVGAESAGAEGTN